MKEGGKSMNGINDRKKANEVKDKNENFAPGFQQVLPLAIVIGR
jgi:hypothetical protein